MKKNALIIMTRIPEAGQTKTRMMPYLSGEQCKKLHFALLKDLKKEVDKADHCVFVYYTGNGNLSLLKKIFGPTAYYVKQQGEDLGKRMEGAIQQVLEKGFSKVLLIGSDIPKEGAKDFERAYLVLDYQDVVLGPSKDGGYYLVGMKKNHPNLFENHDYGTSSVFAGMVAACKAQGLTVGTVKMHGDLDTPEDLAAYRSFLRNQKELTGYTSRYVMQLLKISVIVPIYNERATIKAFTEQLKPLLNEAEIILVDGGSTDGTLDFIPPEITVISTKKGRANQMNAGAKYSHGDVLFFLHADSKLPNNSLAQIKRVMAHKEVGCFGVTFDEKGLLMRINAKMSNLRAAKGIMFGDQGIFISKSLFEKLGGFPSIPIMEDYRFSLNLKEKKIPSGMTKEPLCTSARRYPKTTIKRLKLMMQMWNLRRLYRKGVPPKQLVKRYLDVR